MKEKYLYLLWGFFYLLCAILGFIPNPAGFGRFLLVLVAILFFIPGFLLLRKGLRKKDGALLRRLRIVCICWLCVTLVMLAVNIGCVLASKAVGDAMYILLVVLSSPMICGQYWVLSMFLWACLLICTWMGKKKV